MHLFYVQRANDSPAGPFTRKQIKEDLLAGRWTYDVTVCLEGETRWQRLDQVPHLASLVPGRSTWLKVSALFCALAGAGNFVLLALVAAFALSDGKVTPNEAATILVCLAMASAWVVIARGVYRREVTAYRRARLWIVINLGFHLVYLLSGHLYALAPLPFEAVALVATYLARHDFNLE